MKYDNSWIKRQHQKKCEMNFLFFWGHQPGKDGKITKACFSQWFPSKFEHKGIVFSTAEHWMMAEKAKLFADQEAYHKILNSASPKAAKTLGRGVKNFNEQQWLANRMQIVEQGNYLKFRQNEDLWNFLDGTHNKVLVEASPYDRIWGIGMKNGEKGIEDPNNWQGLNLLGYILMEVREKLRAETRQICDAN